MKAFLFSDLHTSAKQLSNIQNFVLDQKNNIRLLISPGDFVNQGEPVEFIEDLVWVLRKINLPFVWVPGNNDFGRAYDLLESKFPSIEGRIEKIGSRTFSGVGGSPDSWSGQYAGKNLIEKSSIADTIFLSHIPPPGIHNYQKQEAGSKNLGISKKLSDSPIVHICGHYHGQWGIAYLGKTKIIKLATAWLGAYAILDLDTLEVEFGRFNNSSIIFNS